MSILLEGSWAMAVLSRFSPTFGLVLAAALSGFGCSAIPLAEGASFASTLRGGNSSASHETRAVPATQPAAAESESTQDSVAQLFQSLHELFDYYEPRGYIVVGQYLKAKWPAKVTRIQDGTGDIRFVHKNGVPHNYRGISGFRMRVISLEDATGGESVLVLRSTSRIGAREPRAAPHGQAAAPVQGGPGGKAAGQELGMQGGAPVANGKSYESVRDLVADYEQQGFTVLRQIVRSKWPAKVVYTKNTTDHISFAVKNSGSHAHPNHKGYRLKVVFLEDTDGDETAVVFRSSFKIGETPPPPEPPAPKRVPRHAARDSAPPAEQPSGRLLE